MSKIQQIIEQAFEKRADINPGNVASTVKNAIHNGNRLLYL